MTKLLPPRWRGRGHPSPSAHFVLSSRGHRRSPQRHAYINGGIYTGHRDGENGAACHFRNRPGRTPPRRCSANPSRCLRWKTRWPSGWGHPDPGQASAAFVRERRASQIANIFGRPVVFCSYMQLHICCSIEGFIVFYRTVPDQRCLFLKKMLIRNERISYI